MSLESIIYFAEVSDSLKDVSCFLSVVSIFFAFMQFAKSYAEDEEFVLSKKSILIVLISSVLAVAMPGKDTIYLMVGASASKEAVQTETFKKVQRIIDKELDKLLKDK